MMRVLVGGIFWVVGVVMGVEGSIVLRVLRVLRKDGVGMDRLVYGG